VQCDKVDSGCGGGSMDNGFTFAKKHGLALESTYKYTSGSGKTGKCKKAAEKKAAPHSYVASFHDVTPNSEAALKTAVALGPVSVAIEADKQAFQFYKSGVIKSSSGCGTKLDHGVLAVGYGTSGPDDSNAGVMYWKVKNSWGKTWGNNGYVMLERTEKANSKGTCGIAMDASYPKMSTGPDVAPVTMSIIPGLRMDASSHYEDPKPSGCQSGEVNIKIQGVKGDFCSPACSGSTCPADVPTGVTAKPTCALQDSASKKKYCALICTPGTLVGDAQCGKNGSCKSIQSVGVCTYDD